MAGEVIEDIPEIESPAGGEVTSDTQPGVPLEQAVRRSVA